MSKHYEVHTTHTLQSANNFFAKHIILSFSKHKHLWGNWTPRIGHSNINDLQTHKLVPKYNKQKSKPMALHCEKRVKNANTMERKFYGSQNNHSILYNTYLLLQKLTQKMQKAYYLTMRTISTTNSSPLLNIVSIWEILQSIELLCKHVHNKWWVGSKLIPKLWLHKNQSK